MGVQNGGRCRQMVAVQRWSLAQALPYLKINENLLFAGYVVLITNE
jgi:hypothetical protein